MCFKFLIMCCALGYSHTVSESSQQPYDVSTNNFKIYFTNVEMEALNMN